MRSARMLLATATATAALAIAAPAACAEAMGDRDHDNSSYSKEHHKDGEHDAPRGGVHTGGGALSVASNDDWDNTKHDEDTYKDEQGEDSWGDKQDGDPYGDEQGKDSWGDKQDEYGKHDAQGKDSWGDKRDDYGKDDEHGKDDDHEKGSWQGEHDKPRGGMHTGGGALASAPGITAGGLAVLAVAGTGMYALRRQKASRGVA
ncbi:hypothetical protein KEF29_14505 [Streptomyces tuirus]|uniref:Gram-positive cocci surface proteins LPxTG domain-containing protein n=1 Tax=Streptomyces tuirus TaxID=68278 RepID=A0A941FBQ0_9ACTN|nr:hypothetical protein [Streptomyces tuirus]